MSPHLTILCALFLAVSAAAKEKPVIKHKPASNDFEERPVATEILVGPQGSDYAFRIEFDKLPWGDDCKNRCANATIFLDTDNSKSTGLQLKARGALETGADLAVTVQGLREYKEASADVLLRVKVRQLADNNQSVEDGETLAEMDHRHDPERLLVEGKIVYALIDATSGTLPSGSKVRVIYHPPGSRSLVGMARGLLAGRTGKVEIFKSGRKSRN